MFETATYDVTSFVVGLLLGAAIAVAFAVPRIGKIVGTILSITLLASGVGLLAWSVTALVNVGEFRSVGWERLNLSTPIEALGVGGGFLLGGAIAMYLSLRTPRR